MKEYEAGKVSIIIPIRRGERISDCLEAIHKSTYKNYDILIIDDKGERSYQRNRGIKYAKGEYLLILDSDMFITPGLLEECVFFMKFYDCIYIPENIITKGFFAKIRNWERQFYTGTAVDVVRFLRTKDCPLFDENMSGPEDSEWDRRVTGTRNISENHFNHLDNVSFLEYFRKKAYYTKSMKYFKQKCPNDKILNPKWRCFGVFVENFKWQRCLKNPFMTLAVMFILLIRGIIYITRR